MDKVKIIVKNPSFKHLLMSSIGHKVKDHIILIYIDPGKWLEYGK